MQLHDFIFSEQRKYRVLRHVSFWMTWIIFSALVQLTPTPPDGISLKLFVSNGVLKAIYRLPFQLVFCYYVVYLLVPKFMLQKKFKRFGWYLLLSAILLYWLTYFFLTPLFSLLNMQIFGKPLSPFVKYFFSFYSNINFTGPIPACCFMLGIKYYKNWYIKQSESEALLRENTIAELQLLKAQVHPHFLFNTLNNIYSYTYIGNPSAAKLVDKLGGMIDYMCTEGNKLVVPLEKEIQLLNDYIELEKVRYNNRLKIKVEIEGQLEDKFIAPLLMIPFVENCFKHGASKIRGNQWIEMFIYVKDNQLTFNVANSKADESITSGDKKGIGLSNVKKRLQLLYPLHHTLKIESTNTAYSVYLQIQLVEKEVMAEGRELLNPQLAAYA
ncbi:MAG: sensor histidine kinase [Ginsengibacter sp.]